MNKYPMSYKNDVDLFLQISEDARLNKDDLKTIYNTDYLEIIDNKNTDTQGFMCIMGNSDEFYSNSLIISFRGSQQVPDWFNDFDAWHKVIPYGNYNSKIKVHRGFLRCYKSVRDQILDYVKKHESKIGKIYVTGHSLGGALATLCSVDLHYNFDIFKDKIYPYMSGNPAVGNKAFVKSYNKRLPYTIRTYMLKDIVPKMPPWWFGLFLHGGYRHVNRSNPIGPKSFWAGFRAFIKTRLNFAENITNHSIILYRKYC